MPPFPSRIAAVTLAALTVPCASAHADAPIAMEPLKPCYVSVAGQQMEPVPLTATGFDAGSTVDVRLDGTAVAVVTAGVDGRVQARLHLPPASRRERAFRVALVQQDEPTHRARARSRVTPLSVRLRPRAAEPRSTVTWIGRGFTAAGPVYVHYVKDGVARETVRLASPRDACGTFRVRRAQFPFQPSIGAWTLQVDQRRAFAPIPDTAFVQLPVTVRRVPAER